MFSIGLDASSNPTHPEKIVGGTEDHVSFGTEPQEDITNKTTITKMQLFNYFWLSITSQHIFNAQHL